MSAQPPRRTNERGITRRELEVVVRRAVELSAAESDPEERISEEELLRIAAELGLPARHVRQALLELGAGAGDGSLLARICGPAAAIGMRVVPGDADLVFRRLEDYLATREFLQPLRRQQRHGWYAPADDAISRLARVFSRPRGRYHLANARRVSLDVEPLESGASHVRLEADLSDRRRDAVTVGAVTGGIFGAAAGAGLALVAWTAAGDVAGPIAGAAAGILAFGGTFTSSLSAGLAIARTQFRKKIAAARLEVEGLLDRLERGEPLEPPPAPWRRRLFAGPAPRVFPRL